MKRILLAFLAIISLSGSCIKPNDQERTIPQSNYQQIKKLFSEAWQDAKDDLERKVMIFTITSVAIGSTLIIKSMNQSHLAQ